MLHILASLLGYLNGLAHLVADIHAVVLRVCNHTGKLGRVVCNLIDGNGQLIHRHIQLTHGLGLDICRRLHLSGHTVTRIRLRSQFSGNVSHGRNHLLHGCDKALHAAAHKRNLIIAAALDRYGKVAVRQRLDDVRQLPDRCDHNVRCALNHYTQNQNGDHTDQNHQIPEVRKVCQYNAGRNIGNQNPVSSGYLLEHGHIAVQCGKAVITIRNLRRYTLLECTAAVAAERRGNLRRITACQNRCRILVHEDSLRILHLDKRVYNDGNAVERHIRRDDFHLAAAVI